MTFGIVANTQKEETVAVLAKLVTALRSRRQEFYFHPDIRRCLSRPPLADASGVPVVDESRLIETVSMIIALGGDGTMLSTARMIGGKRLPILGINLGKLGFLAEISVFDLESCLDDIVAEQYQIEDRIVLHAELGKENASLTALNEVVIDRGASPRVIDFEAFVNSDFLVTYAADGMLVTTPTGSTGYSLATGGPIVTPRSDVLTIAAISPHTLTARPVIVPSADRIRIRVQTGGTSVRVIADGQVEKFCRIPFECTIGRAPFNARFVKWKKGSYFDLLRTKLMWGKDLRTDPDSGD